MMIGLDGGFPKARLILVPQKNCHKKLLNQVYTSVFCRMSMYQSCRWWFTTVIPATWEKIERLVI
jgi:hypothetical protein